MPNQLEQELIYQFKYISF